jgi:N-acetylglucosaminyldiphosphoundecaprenol N-acetyl-beta-D-mannosaminyltransferase
MDIPTVDILGFPIANIDMGEAVAAAAAMLARRGLPASRIVTANAEILYHGYRDAALGELLHSADLIVPDGIGVVKAAATLGYPVKARVAGVDLLGELAAWSAQNRRSIYLLGAARESVEGAAAALQAKYPALKIAGWHDGYFTKEETGQILQEIRDHKPDFLFIAMSFPAQDRFFEEHKEQLPVGVAMGVGGAFDALSGRVKRAPLWIQKLNLEWAYRFAQNPKRLGRIWALPSFMRAVQRQKNHK